MNNYELAPWILAWAATTLLVLVLAAYRKHLDRLEDTDLHLGAMTPQEAQLKMSFNRRVHRIELLGKSCTVMLATLTALIFALWAYSHWLHSYTYIP